MGTVIISDHVVVRQRQFAGKNTQAGGTKMIGPGGLVPYYPALSFGPPAERPSGEGIS